MCLFMLHLSAQTNQGNLLIGANSTSGLSFQSQDGIDDNLISFSLNARGGYFLIDNLAAGLNLGFSSNSVGDFSSTSFSLGPFARYYFDQIFFGASFVAVNTNSDNGNGNDSSRNGTQFNLELGYAAFLNNNVAIEPAITYLTTGGDFGGLTGFALNIGFNIYL